MTPGTLRIVGGNQSAQEMLGYDVQGLTSRTLFDLMAPEVAVVHKCAMSGKSDDYDLVRRTSGLASARRRRLSCLLL